MVSVCKRVFYCVQFVVFSFADQPNVRTRELGGEMAILKFTIIIKKTHMYVGHDFYRCGGS